MEEWDCKVHGSLYESIILHGARAQTHVYNTQLEGKHRLTTQLYRVHRGLFLSISIGSEPILRQCYYYRVQQRGALSHCLCVENAICDSETAYLCRPVSGLNILFANEVH